jgi:hypothetical protein
MKLIVISLLAINIIYLVFQLWIKEEQPTQAITGETDSSIPRIELITEAGINDKRELEAKAILGNPVTVADVASTGNNSAGDSAGDSTGNSIGENASDQSFDVVKGNASSPETAQDTSVVEDKCLALGAYTSLTSAQNMAERLTAVGVEVDLRAIDDPTGDYDYRVVLPPATSLQEAFRRLRELKSRNIDSYVITQGKNSLGISLGVFSSNSAAINHQQALAKDGYPADIAEIPRLMRGYWIYARDHDERFPPGTIDEARVSGVEITERPCLNP